MRPLAVTQLLVTITLDLHEIKTRIEIISLKLTPSVSIAISRRTLSEEKRNFQIDVTQRILKRDEVSKNNVCGHKTHAKQANRFSDRENRT